MQRIANPSMPVRFRPRPPASDKDPLRRVFCCPGKAAGTGRPWRRFPMRHRSGTLCALPGWRNGRRRGLKIPQHASVMWVRVPPRAQDQSGRWIRPRVATRLSSSWLIAAEARFESHPGHKINPVVRFVRALRRACHHRGLLLLRRGSSPTPGTSTRSDVGFIRAMHHSQESPCRATPPISPRCC
jgi:hypothetical protein